jgi:hypothetical protein
VLFVCLQQTYRQLGSLPGDFKQATEKIKLHQKGVTLHQKAVPAKRFVFFVPQ